MKKKGSALILLVFIVGILLVMSLHISHSNSFFKQIVREKIITAQYQSIGQGVMYAALAHVKKNYAAIKQELQNKQQLKLPIDLGGSGLSKNDDVNAMITTHEKGIQFAIQINNKKTKKCNVYCMMRQRNKEFLIEDWRII